VRLIPAPRGTGIVSAPVPKKLLQMAGIEDCYTSAKGSTGTLGNFGRSLRNSFAGWVLSVYYFRIIALF
jgi:ribosomal protein S5